MKKWQYNIGIVFFAIALIGLLTFAKKRNNSRKVTSAGIKFVGEKNLFIAENFINKMLIETPVNGGLLSKDILNLRLVEQKIKKQKHIKNAEVYVSVNGIVGANVVQRTPIARVFSAIPFYFDKEGYEMPLSSNYAIRVPLVYNYTKQHKSDLLTLINFINGDKFLTELVVGISCVKENDFLLTLRDHGFAVKLGGVNKQELKFENLKAFYVKAEKDKLFDQYKYVNLEIANQVICTKV